MSRERAALLVTAAFVTAATFLVRPSPTEAFTTVNRVNQSENDALLILTKPKIGHVAYIPDKSDRQQFILATLEDPQGNHTAYLLSFECGEDQIKQEKKQGEPIGAGVYHAHYEINELSVTLVGKTSSGTDILSVREFKTDFADRTDCPQVPVQDKLRVLDAIDSKLVKGKGAPNKNLFMDAINEGIIVSLSD